MGRPLRVADRNRQAVGSIQPHNQTYTQTRSAFGVRSETAMIKLGAVPGLTLFPPSVPAGDGQAHLHTSGNCSETSGRNGRNRCARKSRYRRPPHPSPVARRITHIFFSFSSPFSFPFLVGSKTFACHQRWQLLSLLLYFLQIKIVLCPCCLGEFSGPQGLIDDLHPEALF